MSIVHIAGVRLDVGGRVIQRCSLCGAKLCDNLNVCVELSDDGTTPEYPTWQTGRLIKVETGNPVSYVMLPDADVLPSNSCLEFA